MKIISFGIFKFAMEMFIQTQNVDISFNVSLPKYFKNLQFTEVNITFIKYMRVLGSRLCHSMAPWEAAHGASFMRHNILPIINICNIYILFTFIYYEHKVFIIFIDNKYYRVDSLHSWVLPYLFGCLFHLNTDILGSYISFYQH